MNFFLLSSYTALLFSCFPLCAWENTPKQDSPPGQTAESPPLHKYLDLLKQYPVAFGPSGSWKKGEIEIITEPKLVQKIEHQTKQRLLGKGASEKQAKEWSTVGLVAEDNYWLWVRDAVIFPSGVYGTYDRILWKSALTGVAGVGVLPVLSNKKIVLNLTYRHATRCWEIELPRGQRNATETPEQAAQRELLEETGCSIGQTVYLGTLAPDTGVLGSLVPMYIGKASLTADQEKEFSEAIIENPCFTKEEIKEGFSKGYIECRIQGQPIKATCRDPFLSYALFQAEIKGLL